MDLRSRPVERSSEYSIFYPKLWACRRIEGSFRNINSCRDIGSFGERVRKLASAVILALLLVSTLALAFNIQPAEAESEAQTVDNTVSAGFSEIREIVTVKPPKK